MNGLKKVYTNQPVSVRSKIREDMESHGLRYQRLSYWINKEDAILNQIPADLMQIICKNIPDAEHLFKLPSLVVKDQLLS